MAHISGDQLVESPLGESPNDPQSGALPLDGPQKLRGKKRLLQSLQRISSSPSLAKFGRAASSSSYRPGARGSISCISLSSGGHSSASHSHSNSYSSQLSADFSTAPTSIAGTPGPESSEFDFEKLGIRLLNTEVGRAPNSSNARVAVPCDLKLVPRSTPLEDLEESRFSTDEATVEAALVKDEPKKVNKDFNFWRDLPYEVRLQALRHLKHQELVRCSTVSHGWYKMCFDGQLWQDLDASDFYMKIPPRQLARIIETAGPFVKSLNLRGCKQLEDQWIQGLCAACMNLEAVNLQGCHIQRQSLRTLIAQNSGLIHLDLVGCPAVTNTTCKLIHETCPNLQYVDMSFCPNVCGKGVMKIVEGCQDLKVLKVGEVRGIDDKSLMLKLFETNSLEQLDCRLCDISDDVFKVLFEGEEPEYDVLTNQALVPPRKLHHIDFSDCSTLTDKAFKTIVGNVPELENLQLNGCSLLTDTAFYDLFPTTPNLSILNLEGLRHLTNATLQKLAKAACAPKLAWLTISDCEHLGDVGMIALFTAAVSLQTVLMDNTRVGDLTLLEAATSVRARSWPAIPPSSPPFRALRLEVFDCQNVTWTGVREVLARNAEVTIPTSSTTATSSPQESGRSTSHHPKGIISLHCFYGWQQTVDEHEKRVLRGDLAAASRLERKWAEYMVAFEEAGIPGPGGRRRRRRMREAAQLHDEEEGGVGVPGRRRRARSGGCTIM